MLMLPLVLVDTGVARNSNGLRKDQLVLKRLLVAVGELVLTDHCVFSV